MNSTSSKIPADAVPATAATGVEPETGSEAELPAAAPEFGGRKDGTEPTRFGDWEKNGRCIDF